jgi:hypothetical protein
MSSSSQPVPEYSARDKVYLQSTVLALECDIALAELRNRNRPVRHTGLPECPCCKCLMAKCTAFREQHGLDK